MFVPFWLDTGIVPTFLWTSASPSSSMAAFNMLNEIPVAGVTD